MDDRAMRDAYAEALLKLGEEDSRIVVLDADVSKSTRSYLFKEVFPDRFFNMGIAEQNMFGVAAGLSLRGLIPFVNTFSFLATLRAGDQLRNLISYPRLNVKIVGHYGGLSDSFDGPTHQSIEDLALVRAIPNLKVVVPADCVQTEKAVSVIAKTSGPVFFRLCRNPTPCIYSDDYEFTLGKADVVRTGGDITIIAIGIMVSEALVAADNLSMQGIEAEVVNTSTLKPLDEETILRSTKKTGRVITCEEHNVHGGLYAAIVETLAANDICCKVRAIAIKDSYAESGPYRDLLDKCELNSKRIESMAKEIL